MSANPPFIVAGVSTLDREGTYESTIHASLTNSSHDSQFRARNWGGSQGHISRTRLAVQIAKRIAEFITVSFASLVAKKSTEFLVPGDGNNTMHRVGLEGW
jgi:hypothetical protein